MNKYRDKSDFEINVLVAKLELMKITLFHVYDAKYSDEKESMIYLVGSKWCEAELLDYCNNPADAMPIIIENGISMIRVNNEWSACQFNNHCIEVNDSNYYRAAMICFLMMKEAENENNNNS
ncbi:phage protein NinX family protein [Morganella morganii]|uniref:phage protein NinX family protein n=1 Tax=Morganella morganii TaxID=582 RepID=UPI003EBCEDAD